MSDILFKTDAWVFSYRVAGVCVQNGRVLLQKPSNDHAYAFPGGHVEFGETNVETLIREFREEMGADIRVGDLRWVGEVFFPWGDKPCHQICLYYDVTVEDSHTPTEGMFFGTEQLEGRSFRMEFHWVPLERLQEIEVYPVETAQLLRDGVEGVQHFIYRE